MSENQPHVYVIQGHLLGPGKTMADVLWPHESPIGRCMMVGSGAEECTTVVGVVEDAARGGFEDDPFMAYYLPAGQIARAHNGLYVRIESGTPRGEAVAGAWQGDDLVDM